MRESNLETPKVYIITITYFVIKAFRDNILWKTINIT